jgi:urease beta subunit
MRALSYLPPAGSFRGAIWALAVLVWLAGGGRASGQTATGRISGTVLDPTQAAVGGAPVTVRSEALGAATDTVTGASGAFSVVDLAAGRYTVEVDLPGFHRHVVSGVKVDVASETSLPPIVLELGEVTESIEVVAGAMQVQTTNAEMTTTVTAEQIERLPIIGRNALALIHIQAGVANAGANPTVINGQRSSFSNVTLDGINIQDNFIRDNALDFNPNRPLIDQVNEFTITTQNGNPAAGNGSSQVNFTTRSGTNEFHGNVYWHNRNSALSAGEWFSNRQGLEKPFLNWNQFGASLGGPIVRNKLLFYTNYEGFRQSAESLQNATILTPDAARGIFTYSDDNERTQKVNVLRAMGLDTDPKAEEIRARIPGPEQINNFDVGDSDSELLRNTAGYRYLAQNNEDRDASTNRFDWVVSDAHLVSGTYQYTREQGDRPDSGNGFHRTPVVRNFLHSNLLSVGWRWSPDPFWSNELRGGFNLASTEFRTTESRTEPLIGGFLYTNPTVNFDPEGRYTDTYNLSDNVSWLRGNHSFRFGGSLQQVRVESFDWAETIRSFGLGVGFDSQFALDSSFFPGGIAADDFSAASSLLATLSGLIDLGGQTFNTNDAAAGYVAGQEQRRNYSLNAGALYVQDNWRLRPRLTLNLGLRWDYQGRFDERDGLLLNPVSGPEGMIATLLSDATLDFAGSKFGRPLYARDGNNLAPNLGIAYDLFGNGKTALRAGYSINYVIDEMMSAAVNATSQNQGLQGDPNRRTLDLMLSDALPTFDTPEFKVPRLASENQEIDATAAIFTIDPGLRTPYVQQWNVGVQHEIARNTVLDVSYVGNKGAKLLRGFDYNQVIIEENGFLADFLRARSNALLAERRTGEFNPEFNPLIVGSQPLTFFPQLDREGLLTDSLVRSLIETGQPGQLAALYILNEFTEGRDVDFRLNRNTFVADMITNYSNSTYHALQVEVRRRVSSGLQFQANYTFGKVLTDSSGTQVRFDPFLDIDQASLERARAAFDVNHVFNANFVWTLPFGAEHGRSFGSLDKLLGGWTVSSILTWQSGAPLSIASGRGTLNRTARSGQNTAVSPLTKKQLDEVVGFRMTTDGPFFVAPSAINPRDNSGVAPDGEEPFAGQVFFHPGPGEVGNLQRRMFTGPSAFVFDLALDKDLRLGETRQLRFGARMQNLLNHPSFLSGSHFLDSAQFGRITDVVVGARVIEFQLRYSF